MKYGFIYIITNKINGKKYIGMKKYSKGWEDYMGSSKLLKEDISKYGIENFKREIIEECSDAVELQNREIYHLNLNNVLNDDMFYNMSIPHEGFRIKKNTNNSKGKTWEEIYGIKEAKRRKLNSKLKNKTWEDIYGKEGAEEKRKKAREKRSAETRMRMSESRKGIQYSDCTKKKIAEGVRRHFRRLKLLKKIENGEIKNNSSNKIDIEVVNLIEQGFLNVDIRLFYPKYNNRKIKRLKDLYNIETGIFQISKDIYQKHAANIKNNKTKEFLKQYCIDNFLPMSKFCNLIRQKLVKRISEDLIFKIYELAKKNTKRKEISKILNIPFREVIEVLREDGRSKYTEFKKANNLYIERKRNNRLNINEKHEKIVLDVFDMYRKNIELTEIAEKMNLNYGMVYKIIFNKNRYAKIKEKHNLHPIADKFINI